MPDNTPPRPKVVIDTNILVSGVLVKQGHPNRLLRSWQRGAVQLITAPALIAELDRTLHKGRIRRKYHVPEAEIQELLESLREAEETVLPEEMPVASRDPHDDVFLAIALSGKADYLITGDEDLLVLNGHPTLGSLQIVTVRTFNTIHEEQVAE